MINEALFTTSVGMGGVFFVLITLICCMNILSLSLSKKEKNSLEKVALAIAYTKNIRSKNEK